MKKNLLLLFLILFPLIYCHGQVKRNPVAPPVASLKQTNNMSIVDSGRVKIWYALNAVDIKDSKTYDDLQILEIGDNLSRYSSWFRYNSDSLVEDHIKKNPSAQTCPNQLGDRGKDSNWSEYFYSDYFKDFQKNVFTEYTQMPSGMTFSSFYTEEIPIIEWQIHNENLTLAGYVCQKATCHFRGRDFIAWFTTDIPINNGPWKFGGLPGLILKVSDTDMLYDFECVKIETIEQKFPIKKYSEFEDYRKLDRKKHLKLQYDLNDDFVRVVGGTWTNRPPKVKYEALELE